MNANVHSCILTIFTNLRFYFFLSFLNHLFDSGRMDTSIYDQFLKSYPRNLTTNRIKGRQYNCFRCIINNKIYTCKCLKGTDITPFTTDNSSLHLIAWKLND